MRTSFTNFFNTQGTGISFHYELSRHKLISRDPRDEVYPSLFDQPRSGWKTGTRRLRKTAARG